MLLEYCKLKPDNAYSGLSSHIFIDFNLFHSYLFFQRK